MNITKRDIDQLNAEVTIAVTQQDYEPRVNEALKRIQRQAAMPGFRPGKVPAGLIKKQYGKSVMVDELNKMLNESIYNYINEQKIEILGNPMPKDDANIDWDNQTNFEFKYELGLSPQFDYKVDGKQTFTYNTVKVDEELVNKYVADVRRNYGKPSNPEIAEDKDVLFVDIVEVDADNVIVPGGVFKSTSIGIDRQKNEATKKKLVGLKKDDKLVLNSNDLYENAVDKSISLGIDKDAAEHFNANLQLTVRNIARMADADLDQELFDKIYGPGTIASEEEFRAKIREELSMMFVQDSDRKFFQEVEEALVKKLNLQLPDEFLKRWLMAVNEKPITQEQLEADYPNYSKSMQWRLIENKIIKNHEITVSQDEAKEEAKRYVRAEYSRYGQMAQDAELEQIANSILSKEEEAQKIFENLYSKKVMELFKANFKLDNKEVSYNEFFGIKD